MYMNVKISVNIRMRLGSYMLLLSRTRFSSRSQCIQTSCIVSTFVYPSQTTRKKNQCKSSWAISSCYCRKIKTISAKLKLPNWVELNGYHEADIDLDINCRENIDLSTFLLTGADPGFPDRGRQPINLVIFPRKLFEIENIESTNALGTGYSVYLALPEPSSVSVCLSVIYCSKPGLSLDLPFQYSGAKDRCKNSSDYAKILQTSWMTST